MTDHRILLLLFTTSVAFVSTDYWDDREKFIEKEKNRGIGADIVLNDKEKRVNDILMNYKLRELDEGFINPGEYLPAQHFFHSKPGIDKSKVFKLIQSLPKGSSLHSHDTGIASLDYVISLTHRPNLYGCKRNGIYQFRFFKDAKSVDHKCEWQSIAKSRASNPQFDDYIRDQISLIVDNPDQIYTDIDVVWGAFLSRFFVLDGLLTYKPVFQDYFYQVLKELHEDNVMYLEMRGLLPIVYDLEGNFYSPEEVAGLYYETLQKFKEDYPDFHGCRFIYAPLRFASNGTMEDYLQILKNIQRLYPDFIAGFDLVGQEDKGRPLSDFVPQLLSIKDETKFFFHAGETNWDGETDMNLVDAVLLNTTRIGHGYAILKHPLVYEEAKKRKIALEIAPISNQVLKLVEDYRNHPGTTLFADNFPVVICCDDPTFWGSKALSYDWYIAFMAFGARDSDLKLLKQLAINSIIYSAMPEPEKQSVYKQWEKRWDNFIDLILNKHYNNLRNYYNLRESNNIN